MEILELLKGVALIVDDEIYSQNNKNLRNLLKQIDSHKIPYLSYEQLPSEYVRNFNNLSFVLLDWKLNASEGVRMGSQLVQANINFIKAIKDVCFCPIFIFSDENVDEIKDELANADLYDLEYENTNHIFVQNKKDLRGTKKLFNVLANWIKSNPSMYVLKEWENEYQKSKNNLFSDFYALHHAWPRVMWKTFKDDKVDPAVEISGMITNSINAMMSPFKLEPEILDKRAFKIEKTDIRRVIEGTKFIKNERIHATDIAPGDVFKCSGGKYYINIRPACNCIPRNGTDINEIELYLLKGQKLSDNNLKKKYRKEFGNFFEKDNEVIVFPIYDLKGFVFYFKDIINMKWGNIASHRIGRLQAPCVNKIQQKYSAYLQRQGIARTPHKAV